MVNSVVLQGYKGYWTPLFWELPHSSPTGGTETLKCLELLYGETQVIPSNSRSTGSHVPKSQGDHEGPTCPLQIKVGSKRGSSNSIQRGLFPI